MQYKKIMILTIVLIFLLAISTASAADNVTDEIVGVQNSDNNLTSEINSDLFSNNDKNVLNANQKTFTDLNNAINGNTKTDIYLNSDYTYNPYTDSSLGIISIDRAVTIHGNGYTIDGLNSTRIFIVNSKVSDKVIFRDIIFVNGKSYVGGAICRGSAVNCTFINNYAEKTGGAIYSDGGTYNVLNCTFINNSAGVDGGAIYGDGSAVNCIFINNSASDWGGAMYEGSAVNCTFINNSADTGGAMYEGSAVNCTFINNYADWAGGAMRVSSSSPVVNCSFINNSAENGGALFDYNSLGYYSSVALNCSFAGNSAGADGGALCRVSAFNCVFQDNHADFNGGAMFGDMIVADYCVFINNSATNGGATYQVTNNYCTFNENTALENGGSVYGHASFKANFTKNHANNCGGAMYDGSAINCSFIDNSAKKGGAMSKGRATDCIFYYNNATAYGGAIYGAKVSTSSKFKKNYAPHGKNTYNVTWFDTIKTFSDLNELINNYDGADIYLNSDYVFDLTADSSFKDGIVISHDITIHGNGHTIDGTYSARILFVSDGNVNLRDIVFVNGNTMDDGGAIYVSNSSSTVVNCSFIGNYARKGGAMSGGSAVNCNFVNNYGFWWAGAMYGGSAVNCSFFNNSARLYGGAMYGGSAVNCNFVNNSAESGGAMYEGSSVNCTFINNTATDGGAMVDGSAFNCSFVGNSARNGGAMVDGSAFNCIFIGNSADRDGGAMDSASAFNCIFINNSGRDGGAVFSYSYESNSVVNCTFINNSAELGGAMKCGHANNCTFINNSARNGGAIYDSSSKFSYVAVNSIFISNSAIDSGGAIYHSRDDYSSIVNCSFVNNSACYGGAIYDYIYNSNSVVNSSFTENSANYNGGAAVYGSFSNCIFTRNSAYKGGAISNFMNFITGCTFIENSANVGGAIDSGISGTIRNCNFTGNSALWEAGAVYSVNCVDCNFTENYADYGGAMKDGSANNCIFTGNYAIFGGASYESTSVNCSFIENYADYGGAIYDNGLTYDGILYDDPHTEDCSFIGNIADFGGAMYGINGTAVDCRFINNTARYGGATYQMKAKNCYFKGNKATENGGAMYGESATNCIFEDNNAKDLGNDTYNTIIPDSSYDNKIIYFDASAAQDGDGSKDNPYKYLYANRFGSGVTAYFAEGTYYLNSTCIITGVTKLIGNSYRAVIVSQVPNQYDFIVKDNACLELYSLYLININILNQATLMASETYFEGNDVFDSKNLPEMESGSGIFDSSYGGVIVCDTPSNVRSTLILNGCNFEKVYNALNGGAIAAINSDISIYCSRFMQFSSTYKGGAIYCVNSNLNLYDTGFTPYTISSDEDFAIDRYVDYTSYYGGSIYCEDCDMFIHQSEFNGSLSSSFGGCIASLNSRIAFEESSIDCSLSLTDGGGAIYNSKSELRIFDSIFDGNSAEFGGAICNINSVLDSYCTDYRDNFANYYGGVVYDIYGTLDFFKNKFYGSHALVGGSIYTRITNSFNSYSNNFTGSFAQEGAVIFFDGKKEELGSYFNSFGNNYHLFAEFRATLNGEDYYLISNPLFYQLSSETDSDLYYPYSIFEVDDNLVSMVIYDMDDDSNLTSIATGNVIRNVSAKISISEEFINPVLNFYLLEDINSAVFFNRHAETKVYLGSRDDLFDGYNVIKTYSITLSDNNDYNLLGSCSIDFSIKSGNIYEDNSSYPVSIIYSSIIDSSSTPSNMGNLLSYYNSNDYGLVSSVKDQKNGGNCWAFAGLATLETCLKKATGVTYDFSEENAKNLMAAYSVYGVKIETNFGGYDSMMMSYLTSWLGPIDESTEGYDDYSTISVLGNSMFHIQNIKFLPARLNSNDNDLYKLAIRDYGAVSVIFKWGKDYHAVSLVGWDDDYKGYDSIGNKANGAWIFKNSFGEDWENGGFGYLSYNQKISEQIDPSLHAYTFIFSDANPYEKIYQYDFAGVSQFYHYKGSIYFKNTFEAEDDSLLSAFSTYFDTQTDYTVSVYVNDQFVFTQNGTSAAGYYTIPFNNFIQLNKGDKFTIMIHNHNKDGYSCIPLCYAEEITKKTFSTNVSFVSLDGETWYDLYDYADSCHVACIKAFTQNINLRNIKISANKIKTVNTRNFNVKVSFDNFERISSINYCLLKFTIDGKNYYAQIKDGMACLNLNLEDGRHTLSAQYRDNVFESNVIKFSFTVDTSQESNSFNALQDIINGVSDKSTISLDKDYVYDEYLDDGDYGVFIDKQITINGNGHVIDGLNKATGFYVASDNVVLNDILFVNTFAINGGGVFIAGRNVTLKNCIFINSKATQSGGAIYSLFDINLNNCQFINDSANMGGGLYLMSTETSHVENSCFNDNSAIAHGSAIYMTGIGDVLISSSNFTSNLAGYNGGAVFSGVYSNKFSDCNFIDNFANCGGAVFSNALFNEFINCNFVNNTATVSSGAINAHNTINIHNSDFINNSVVGKNSSSSNLLGGYGGGAITSYDDLNIYDSNFINNHVSTSGGAIYTNKYLNIYKSNFINNSASGEGGAIYNNPWQKINNNIGATKFTESNYYDCTFIGNHANNAGAIYSSDLVENCTFINNSASNTGGALVEVKVVNNSIFINNSAGEDGGVIYSNGDVSIYTSSFINNSADGEGGALYLMENSLINDSIFVENNAKWGGAILNNGNTSINTCNFTKNYAIRSGGSIYSEGTLNVADSYFDENTANSAGALFLETEGNITNSRFTNNSASNSGGALYLMDNGIINDSIFVENNAKWGGAILNYGDLSINTCNFTKNSANASGGAIYTDGKGIVENSLFAENNATWGGAVINFGNASLNTCNFTKNYAISTGGAMNGGNASNCTFISNSASYGGAISNGYAVCCYFKNNTASSDGDDTYETEVITPILSVHDFTSNYNSGDKLITNLINPSGALINDANVTIDIYKKGKLLNTYYCLSGDDWVVDLVPGNYIAVVSANPGYLIDPVNATIKINKADTSLTATANNTELVATLTYSTTGKAIKGANIVISINSENYTLKTNSKGQVKLSTVSSEYTAVVSYAGNTKFNPSNTSINHTSKIDMIISAVYNTGNKEIIATLTNSATGKPVSNANVNVNLNGESTTVKTNNKGQAIISTADLPDGSYTATFSYKGNSKYKPASTSFDFNTKADMIISAVYDFANKQIVATLTNSATGKPVTNANVKVNLNGESTTVKTNNKGRAIISAADLTDDSYTATFSYKGSSKYNPASASISFDVKTKVIITDVYGYQDKLVATLTNGATGNPIVNAYMQVKINGMTYTAKSNSKSQISIDTSDLGLTKYDVTISYGGNSRYTPSSATVAIDLNKANMNIKYSYNADTKELVATLKNSKTGKVISNANMVVDINRVKTTLKSNNKGQIIFSTADFAPGNHVGTITYGGNDRYNSISAAFKVDI